MKTSLSHIPKEKKEELKSIITTLLAFKEVEIIILFGSYAMGNFTEYNRYEEDGIIYEYKSDFDLLVILNKNKDAENLSFNYLMANQLNNLPCFTPISPIFEGVNFVNEASLSFRRMSAGIARCFIGGLCGTISAPFVCVFNRSSLLISGRILLYLNCL